MLRVRLAQSGEGWEDKHIARVPKYQEYSILHAQKAMILPIQVSQGELWDLGDKTVVA